MVWFCQSRCLRNLSAVSLYSQTAACGSLLTGWSRERAGGVTDVGRVRADQEKLNLFIRICSERVSGFSDLRLLWCACVFLVVGGERHVFKVHVNGVKKGVYRL